MLRSLDFTLKAKGEMEKLREVLKQWIVVMGSESLWQQSTRGVEEKGLQTGKQANGLFHSPHERRGDWLAWGPGARQLLGGLGESL